MRAYLLPLAFALVCLTASIGQQPAAPGQGPLEPDREILREIREAYKAPFEVHQDVLKELRRQYQQPSPQREATILRELRRLYVLTPERETTILAEIRKAYQQQSAEQEAQVFGEISKAERLPNGAVPVSVQSEQAAKLFRRLDADGDGRLSADEMPQSLRGELARWDKNRDGAIDENEYSAYYQDRLRRLSDEVAAGRIELGLKRGGPIRKDDVDARPSVYRAGKMPKGLPAWFEKYDLDKDGQISLAEWRKAGKSLEEFAAIDRNDDGLLTPEEVLRYEAAQRQGAAGIATAERQAPTFDGKKGKKKP